MAVVFFDGFDLYADVTGVNTGLASSSTRWTVSGGPSLQTGRFGGKALGSFNSSDWAGAILPAAVTSLSTGFAFKMTAFAGGTGWFLSFVDPLNATYHVGLTANADKSISAYRATSASAGTLLGTTAINVLNLNAWHYIEIELTISDTVGVVNIYVDSVQVLNLTNVDTRNGTPTQVQRVRLGFTGGTSSQGYYYDDFYVTDSIGKLGERMVEPLRPSADTADADWTPLSGTDRYAMVDDTQCDGSTTYNSASNVGDFDLYDLVNLSSTPTTIDGLRVFGWSQKSDALGGRQICLPVKSGGTQQDGSNFVLSSAAWAYNDRGMFLTDPNTGVAWTAAGVNALQIGAKVTA